VIAEEKYRVYSYHNVNFPRRQVKSKYYFGFMVVHLRPHRRDETLQVSRSCKGARCKAHEASAEAFRFVSATLRGGVCRFLAARHETNKHRFSVVRDARRRAFASCIRSSVRILCSAYRWRWPLSVNDRVYTGCGALSLSRGSHGLRAVDSGSTHPPAEMNERFLVFADSGSPY